MDRKRSRDDREVARLVIRRRRWWGDRRGGGGGGQEVAVDAEEAADLVAVAEVWTSATQRWTGWPNGGGRREKN